MTTPLHRRTDDELVLAARAGEREAAGEIARRYRRDLLATARRVLRGTGLEPEDAVQDVLARLPRALRVHDRPIQVQPWLRAAVRNRCLDLRRMDRPRVDLPLHLAGPVAAEPAAVAERRQDVLRVVGAVAGLPDRQRRALVLHAVDGRSQAEVAAVLGTSVPATKGLVSRSRQTLRATIGSGGF